MTARRILMVEDDPDLAALVAEFLGDYGLAVDVVPNGGAAAARIRDSAPDLVILDLMLPEKDGLQICREIRGWFTGPILMLTARSNWVDEIVGLEVGADDYLGKPVEPRLLLARIRTLLRRSNQSNPVAPNDASSLEIRASARTAAIAGRDLGLTDAEFDLLAFLAEHPGQTLSRARLYREVLGATYDGQDRILDVRVSRLRAKLGDDGKQPRWIKAVRGVGYLFLGDGA